MSMIDWAKRELDLAGYAESDDPVFDRLLKIVWNLEQ